MFTLDDIREKAEASYGDTPIDLGEAGVLRLLNPLRLEKAKRKALMSIQSDLDAKEGEEEADQGEVLADAIRLVADKPRLAEIFLSKIGDDLTMLAATFELYTKGTQAGEASASQS